MATTSSAFARVPRSLVRARAEFGHGAKYRKSTLRGQRLQRVKRSAHGNRIRVVCVVVHCGAGDRVERCEPTGDRSKCLEAGAHRGERNANGERRRCRCKRVRCVVTSGRVEADPRVTRRRGYFQRLAGSRKPAAQMDRRWTFDGEFDDA